jgi:DoxX-like family
MTHQTTTHERLPRPLALRPRPGAGAALTGLVALFLAFDGITKLLRVAPVVEASQKLGVVPELVAGIGALLLACTVLYLVPRTAMLGAILLTGYLGGATATHVVARSGTFETVFPVGFGVLTWAGLILREPHLIQLLFLRRLRGGQHTMS